MGLISVGASLGVANRSASRVPSVPPSAAVVASSNGQGGGTSAAHLGATPVATASQIHHQQRRHEFAHHRHNYSNSSTSSQQHDQQAVHPGSGRSKRGGRRKYVQNSNQNAVHTNAATPPVAIGTITPAVQFPPPPIVTAQAALPSQAAAKSPSSATKMYSSRPIGNSALTECHRISVPPSPSQIIRAVTFQTNVDPQRLLPFVLGAKGGARLQSYMAQSKCAMAHRPTSPGQSSGEQLIRLNRGGNPSTQAEEWKMSFSVTADNVRRVEHGVRLLQSAIEAAEQIILRKKPMGSATAVASTSVEVDSGGNGKPSSGHASASRAATSDHSINDPPPAAQLPASSSSPAPSRSLELSSSSSRDSVDERKAQTRIRYPPANQPLKHGLGFASNRSIVETTMSPPTSAATPLATDRVAGKKRQLPSSNDEANKRERVTSAKQTQLCTSGLNSMSEHDEDASCVTTPRRVEPENGQPDSEFDEFRIRLSRGIDFARRIDAQANQVKRKAQREKKRYLKMRERARMMEHQQRVADVVIRTQCAIMATNEPSGRKRRRIEQLSVIQDSIEKMPLPRVTSSTQKRRSFSHPIASTSSDRIVDLMKKVSAFRMLLSKEPSEEVLVPPSDSTSGLAQSEEFKSAEEDHSVHRALDDGLRSRSEVVDDISIPEDIIQGHMEYDDSFRSHVASTALRDMNLIQDYSGESHCALLRLLVGQRQYFYLEPISLSFGTNDLDFLKSYAIRTENDLEVLRQFVVKRRRFGSELAQSVEEVASNSEKSLTSSRCSAWTSMQRPLLDLHPVLLALHVLALHYHASAILDREKISSAPLPTDLLESEDELSLDLFKFVLRPIRSSAIESSLNDALPVSLVRETIAHCPEVVNHVLDWKEESDVPQDLLQDITSLQSKKEKSNSSSSVGSAMLSEILKHLQRHARDFDRSIRELARHLQGSRGGGSYCDKVVHLVNQIKSLSARLLVVNTELQLHKWATQYVENGYTWFDEDIDNDLGSDSVMCVDRSYDKFTCLQDALLVWHNAKVVYVADDGYSGRAKCDNDDVETVSSKKGEPDEEGEPLGELNTDEDTELIRLRNLTPPDVLSIVESCFTDLGAVASYCLSSDDITRVRREFNDSLGSMRGSMKILGRTAPWRTHVKHSNALKVEYKKQRELENKMLLHQWAVYYKTRPLPNVKDIDNVEHEEKQQNSGDGGNETTPVGSSTENDGGIVLEPGDTPEVVDMKLLRHEIENVAKQMQAKGAVGPIDPDKKKLLDACNLLAASCVSALTKFLSPDDPPPLVSSAKSAPGSGRTGRQRANSTSKTEGVNTKPVEDSRVQSHSKPITIVTSQVESAELSLNTTTDAGNDNLNVDDHAQDDLQEHTSQPDLGRKMKKGSATRRPRAHSTSSVSPRLPSAVNGSVPPGAVALPGRSAKVASMASHTHASTVNLTAGVVAPVAPEPLRMGCSGCRDTRRRCTGCHGCCLHCVCLGCGCRMCCSSRIASVQKTLNLLVTAVETRMRCKWIELDSRGDQSERCGMMKACSTCQQCSHHCSCHPSARSMYDLGADSSPPRSTSHPTVTAGFPSNGSRKERRFRINPTAAQRRQNQVSGASDDETKAPSSRRGASVGSSAASTKRTRRSNSDATPSMYKDDSVDSTTGSDFMSSDQFSGSSTDGLPFGSGLPTHAKNEQEDLFRAARVRMKLQRNSLIKNNHPYGMIPPNTLIEGEMLWHPERIRLMWERKDVYGVLGVPREASSQLIKKQYRKLVLKLHPDKATPSEITDATSSNHGETWSLDDRVSAFVAVTKAYKLLSGDIGAIHGNSWTTPTAK